MRIVFTVITLLLAERHSESYGSGFDAYSSCYRTSRQRQFLPCDFTKQNWCSTPGSTYPWHAVRRFVHENQGLMKRMYGEERHISVLRAELDNNEIEYFYDVKNKEEAKERYSKTMTSTLFSGEKTSKSVKTKKAISNLGSNSFGKNSLGEIKKLYADLSKSTPLLTLKPQTTQETSTTSTTEPTSTTTSTTTIKTSSVATSTSPPTSQVEPAEQPHSAVQTTLQPNDSQTITETDLPFPTTDLVSDVESTTEEENDVSEESSYAEQENYDESVEDDEEEEDSGDAEKPPAKSPPILRLKGINACPVKEEVVAPFWANNTRGEVLALLNLYPFEQYVHWEKCSYEHKQMFCREGCRCEQQYRLHRLLAYDPNNECRGIFSDWFRFPSCCVCKCYDVPMELRLTSRSPRSPHPHPPSD